MAEITRQRIGELLHGVMEILTDQPDGLPAKDVLARLEASVPPTPFEASSYPGHPNVRRFEKIVRFSTIPVVKAGWLVKDKGRWFATEEGLRAHNSLPDPEKFAREATRKYKEWKDEQPVTDDPEPSEAPEAATILEEAEEAAWEEIRQYLAEMPPFELQNLVAGLLRAMDYHVLWISPPGPDKGIDIIAHEDPLGIKVPTIKVQVKRRQDRISVDGLRAFMAQLGSGDVGLFVSTGGFTKDAEDEARSQQIRRITLLDAQRLVELWVEHHAKIAESARRLLPLRPVWFLDPDE